MAIGCRSETLEENQPPHSNMCGNSLLPFRRVPLTIVNVGLEEDLLS